MKIRFGVLKSSPEANFNQRNFSEANSQKAEVAGKKTKLRVYELGF